MRVCNCSIPDKEDGKRGHGYVAHEALYLQYIRPIKCSLDITAEKGVQGRPMDNYHAQQNLAIVRVCLSKINER